MTQYVNQFSQSPEVGMLDLRFNGNTVQCMAYNTTLVAGQAVKLSDVANGIPYVVPCGDTDEPFGFVNLDAKKTTYTDYDVLEVSLAGNVMYMKAGAAIAANANIMYVAASSHVITATGTTKYISGKAYSKAASGDIFRVWIKTFPHVQQPSA